MEVALIKMATGTLTVMCVVLLLHAYRYSVVAQPAGRPHLANFLSSVDGDVDNYTSNIVGTIPKWLKATKFNNGTNSVCRGEL